MWVFLVMGWLASVVTGNAPVFSSIPITSTPVNSSYSYIVSASANPAPNFLISGAPNGITITPSGVISGIPTATGSFNVDITAFNTDGSTNQSFPLVVGSVPTLSGTPTLSATIGVPYSITFGSSGFPAPTLAFSGPSWMSQSGSTFSGTPTVIGSSQITVTATNQFGVATEIWALNVVGVVPAVSGTPSNNAVVGTPYSATFSSSGTGPFTWTIANAPSWLSINSTTGALSGTPDVGGSYPSVIVTATNSGGSSSLPFSLTVNGVIPTIGGTPVTTANVSVPYSFTIVTTGRPAPTVSISGGPSWLSVSNGVVSGTPDVPGNFPNVIVTATNSQGSNQIAFALNVIGNTPSLLGGALPTAIQGAVYTYTIPRNGVPLGTCSFSGVPAWLMSDPTMCTLSGTPTTSGPFSFNVTQSNSQGTDTKTFSLYVRGIITCSPPTAIVNLSYSYTCTSTSLPAPTFALAGGPPGITMSSAGVFSGIPTAVGRFSINVSVTNNQETVSRPTSLLVLGNAAPVFISTPPNTAATNQLFSYEMQAQGRPDANFSLVSGPSWLHLVDGNYLEGMPANSDEGSIVVVVQADNGVNPSALQKFVLNVQQFSPVIKSSCSGVASTGVQYTCDLFATGTAPISFLIGTAPEWLSLDGCCKLIGTPNASQVGSSSIVITASNSYLPNDIQIFNILVGFTPTSMPTSAPTMQPSHAPTFSSAPAFASTPPTAVTIGSVYFYPVNVTGAPAPTLSASVADLPSWLHLVGNILTGSPPSGTAGTVTILLTASNGVGSDAKQSFVLVISNPPTAPHFLSTPKLSAAVGSPYNYPAVVATGTPTPNYTYTGPTFLSLVPSNGVVSLTGTPPVGTEGTYSVMLVAANGVAPPDSQTFSLTVSPMVTPQPTFAPTSSPILARITSSPPQSASSSSPFIYVITGTGSPAPIFNVSGLPSWLSFTNGNTITGAPPAGMSGSSTFKVIGSQGGQSVVEQYVTIGINTNGNAPFITSSPPLTGALGSVYTYVARATGSPAPVFLWTLPSWLTSTSTPTGDIISGVPTSAGNFTVSLVASNGVSPAAYQSFNLSIIVAPTPAPSRTPTSNNNNVATAPIITSVPPSTATTGSTFLYHVVAIGSPTPLIEFTQLPSWLQKSGCCDVTGTVPDQATGSVTWIVSANNGVLPSASQTVTITFQSPPAPKITSLPVQITKAAALYQYVISAQGNPLPTITAASSLPAWLSLMGNILIGTPPSGTQGVIPVSLIASNGISPSAEQDFTITVEEQLSAPSITSLAPTLPLNNGSLFNYIIFATGNPSPTFSPVNVPSWLTLSGNTLSGYAPQEGGRYEVIIQAKNGILPNDQQNFTIQISSKPALDLSGAPASASVGFIYSYNIETTTSPPPTFTISGNATSWLGLNGNTISGSPPTGANGTFCYAVTATNSLGSDTETSCFNIVAGTSCVSTLTSLVQELQTLLNTTRVTCDPSVTSSYPNSTCHQQCDSPFVLRNDLTIGISSGRRLMSRVLLAISSSDQSTFDASTASQWGLPTAQVHTMSTSSSNQLEVFAITSNNVPALSTVNGIPVSSFIQTSAAQSDMLALIADMIPKTAPQVSQSSTDTITVTADTAWYAYLIVMLLIATVVCWLLFLFCLLCRKDQGDEETQKLRAQSVNLEKYTSTYRSGGRSLEDEEIRAAQLELENYNRELEALQEVHEEAKAEAARKEQAGQFEQAEVSRLLKQMVELEATQQQQHAAQVAALNSEISSLKARAAGSQDSRHGDRLAQAQQHEELKRLSEEYQKLKSDRALLQADDLKNQKKLLDTVENLTRALEKSRADSEEMRNAIEEEKRRRLLAENARFEREKQDRAAREQDRLLEEKARLLREQADRDRAAKDRERAEKDRLQRERERLEAERDFASKERERLEKDRLQRERERLEAERELAAKERERVEKDRLQRERERLEAERLRLNSNREQIEKDRLEKERAEVLLREREALEAERRRLEAERLRTEKDRLEKERLLLDRAAIEKEKARLEADRLLEKQRLEKDRAALEAEKARLGQERLKKEEDARKKKELDAERLRLAQEKEQLARDREHLQRQHEERARSKSPLSPDPNGFSDDSGIEDDSGGSEPEPTPLRFPKGPGLQDSDDDELGGNKYKTLSRAQGGVLEQWKQREKAANDLKAKEKRRAARRLARRKARHEARREARLARESNP